MSITTRHQLNKDYQLIERFFDFDLTEEERQAFEQRMENEPIFLKKVQNYQLVEKRVEAQFAPETLAAKQQLQTNWKKTLHQATKIHSLTTQKSWLRTISIAASFVLLIALTWWLIPNKTNNSPQILAQEYYEKTGHLGTSNLRSFRSSTEQNPTDKTLLAASETFSTKKYEVTLKMLQPIPSIYPLYHQVVLLRGQCYFELENWTEAAKQFQAVLNAPEGGRKDLALWYQALVYLQQKEVEKARLNLEKIVVERYPIAKEAEQLLQTLKQD